MAVPSPADSAIVPESSLQYRSRQSNPTRTTIRGKRMAGDAPHRSTADFQESTPNGSHLNGMACRSKCDQCVLKITLLHEQVVRIEGRDHEDSDPCFRQRRAQRGDDTDHRECHRSCHSKVSPTSLTSNVTRNMILLADD